LEEEFLPLCGGARPAFDFSSSFFPTPLVK